MPRIFNRIVSLHIEGEIYDSKETSPESIIRNYTWSFINNDNGSISLIGKHKDHRGRITKINILPKIYKYKKPDTEFFLKM